MPLPVKDSLMWLHGFLNKAVARLMGFFDDADAGPLFLIAVLDFSNISLMVGRGIGDIELFLLKAQRSTVMGARRSHALLGLHIISLYYFTDRRDDALRKFKVSIQVHFYAAFVAGHGASEQFVAAFGAYVSGFLVTDPFFRSDFPPIRNSA